MTMKPKSKKGITLVLFVVILLCLKLSYAQEVSADAEEFRYTISDETVTIDLYIGNSENIEIPSTIEGYPVIRVDDSAFSRCKSIKSVVIPETVTYIGKWVFSNSSVEKITIRGNASFGASFCENSYNLKEVIFENGVTYLSSNMFKNCYNLEKVLLPNSLEGISSEVFYGCTSLKEIELPNGITSIGESAFYNSAIEKVTIPGGVSMGRYCFKDCKELKEVIIENGVKELPLEAFYRCKKLMHVSLPDSLERINHSSFVECSSLQIIDIPKSVKYIGKNAFYDSSIEKITIPGMTQLDESSFRDCKTLKEVIIENGTTELSDRAFSRCESLVRVSLPESMRGINKEAFDGCINLEIINWPEKLDWIEEGAFRHCESLETVMLPNELKQLEAEAFRGCKKLKSIKIPESITVLSNSLFAGCTALNEVVFSSNLREIHRGGFANTALQYVDIPKTVTYIGESAFATTLLEKVTIPNGAVIDNGCFKKCENLKEVIIGNGITEIPSEAFDECKNLVLVSLPKSVIKIRNHAFRFCQELEGISLPEGVVEIGEGAFKCCYKLKHIELPDGITSLSRELFSGCNSLSKIKFPRGLRSIHYSAIEYCDSLKHVELPKFVNDISWYAFLSCSELESVVIPEGVTELLPYTFWWCDKLRYVTLPSNISSIANDVSTSYIIFRVPEGSNTHKYLESRGGYDYELIPVDLGTETERIEKALACSEIEYIAEAEIGDTVVFGSYEQDNNFDNGQEAVEWQVLDKKEGKVLLLSKYALDTCPYNYGNAEITWESSYIRHWLYGGFFWKMFTDAESEYVLSENLVNQDNTNYKTEGGKNTNDKLFLLSYNEVLTYFNDSPEVGDIGRQVKLTDYALAQGGWKYNSENGDFKDETYDGNCSWWLRTPGVRSEMAVCVNYMGSVDPWGSYSFSKTKAIRPAVWINVGVE